MTLRVTRILFGMLKRTESKNKNACMSKCPLKMSTAWPIRVLPSSAHHVIGARAAAADSRKTLSRPLDSKRQAPRAASMRLATPLYSIFLFILINYSFLIQPRLNLFNKYIAITLYRNYFHWNGLIHKEIGYF